MKTVVSMTYAIYIYNYYGIISDFRKLVGQIENLPARNIVSAIPDLAL